MSLEQESASSGSTGGFVPAWLRAIDRPLAFVERIFGSIAVAALVLLILNTAINAATRNLWSAQIPGSQNITILYFLPAIVFLGLTVVQANNSHIAATLVVEKLGRMGQRACKIISNALIAFACLLMFTGAWSELLRAWGSSLGGFPDLHVGPSWVFVPVGFAIVMLRAIQQILVHILVDASDTRKTADSAAVNGSGASHA